MAHRRAILCATASVSAVASLPLSFVGFRWLLIRYDEWRIGHRLVWIIREETNAALLAVITAVVVFFVVVSAMKRLDNWRESDDVPSLSRFGLFALVGFSASSLIALGSYSLGLWLGRNSDNLEGLIHASIPFALIVGVAAVVQPRRKVEQRGTPIIAVLVGVVLGFAYTFIVARYALVIPAFIVLMLSCWVPGGISAMAVAARTKQPSVVVGVTGLCLAAIFLTEPTFNLVTHNRQLTVALITPSEVSTVQLEAQPETLGFNGDDEIQAAKRDVLERVRNSGHTEAFRVLSITRAGKGRKSLAVIIIRAPIAKEVVLPEPDGSTVVYTQQSDTWEKNPTNAPVLHRGVTMRPCGTADGTLGCFEIPDAQGVSLGGRIAVKSTVEPSSHS
jgi:hypothetical protein